MLATVSSVRVHVLRFSFRMVSHSSLGCMVKSMITHKLIVNPEKCKIASKTESLKKLVQREPFCDLCIQREEAVHFQFWREDQELNSLQKKRSQVLHLRNVYVTLKLEV